MREATNAAAFLQEAAVFREKRSTFRESSPLFTASYYYTVSNPKLQGDSGRKRKKYARKNVLFLYTLHKQKRTSRSPSSFRETAKMRFNYSLIAVTTPEPTVLPPSRIAKRRPSSIAIGVINSTSMVMLSPGMHISVPSGSLITPVTSVVLK